MHRARLYFSLWLTVRWLAFVGLIVTRTLATLATDGFGGFTFCQPIGATVLAGHCWRL
jgi:hypothetical protein